MENKQLSIQFDSSLTDIVEVNPSFDYGKLRIAYTGRNRNNTYISKESFERAVPSMFNCPVVANYMRETDEIGSHDGEWVKDKNGEVNYVMVTQPVGVVPESAHWYWEDVSDNGEAHRYLCTDVLLWKRQEAYQKIKENGVTKHSMEISVTDGKMRDDYYEIKDFIFTAFCLLGTAEPCFESAALFTFSEQEQENFKLEYTQMLNELKELGCSLNQEEKEVNVKLDELLKKYSVSMDDIEFEVEGLTDEELESKFIEVFGNDDPVDDDDDDGEDDAPTDEIDHDNEEDGGIGEGQAKKPEEFVLDSQVKDALYAAVHGLGEIEDDWGSYPRYYIADYDVEAQEVYFMDLVDCKLYGCKFAQDGDDIVLDAENIIRKKYEIVDYVEGSGDQMFNLDEIMTSFKEAYDAKEDVNADEFERLQKFEADVLRERRENAEAELFAEFEDQLKGNESFEALRDKAGEYELDDLRKELFALIGQLQFTVKADTKPTPGIVFEDKPKNSSMRKLFAWKDNE